MNLEKISELERLVNVLNAAEHHTQSIIKQIQDIVELDLAKKEQTALDIQKKFIPPVYKVKKQETPTETKTAKPTTLFDAWLVNKKLTKPIRKKNIKEYNRVYARMMNELKKEPRLKRALEHSIRTH